MDMKTVKQRVDEFINYHMTGDGECNNAVLKEWARRRGLSFQQRYELSFMFSVTYCVASAIILFEESEKNGGLNKEQLAGIKKEILFQSDRKYMRMKDSFEKCMLYFYENNRDADAFLKDVQNNGSVSLEKAIEKVSGWVMFGRFSAYLFLETLVELIGAKTENTSIEWNKGDTATSGLLNVFGYDKQADAFDKKNVLFVPKEKMDKMLLFLLEGIRASGGDDNVTKVETSLCAYRKFYKGSRYNGYYLDRMLEELEYYNRERSKLAKELFDIRREKFDKKYLGEISGWKKIRPEMKKLYKETGIVT